MKIAIFSDTFYPNLGGLEDSTAILAKALGEDGHVVDLYVPSFSPSDFFRRGLPLAEIDLGPKVQVHRLFSLPLPSWLLSARLPVPTLAGYRLLKKNRPDIIHTQTIFSAGLEALWASSLLKIPLVGTNHSIISEFCVYFPFAQKFFINFFVWYETWYYNHCIVFTAPSRVALQAMQKNGIKQSGIFISNIIDTDNFQPQVSVDKEKLKEEFGLSSRPVVSFAGRFVIEKKVEILLRAILLVRGQVPRVVLALAGFGSERDNWEKLIRDLGLQDNVKFVGALDKPQLAKLFQASDVFAIASSIESQGMVALQAMACGLPVVGVNGRALPEYVNEENGFIVPIDDYRQMAEALVKLLNNPERSRALGQVGREKVQKYSKQNITKRWTTLYQQAISDFSTVKK